MIELAAVSARGPLVSSARFRARPRAVLTNVNLEHRGGVLGIIGAPNDGTSLLFDVLDGSAKPTAGRASIFGTSPEDARRRLVRVSVDAPLPEALRVDEVCDLASEVRDEPRRPAIDRLGAIGLGALARRRVRSLAVEERRAVALAIALTSAKADVLLVEEPLVALDPVAPRLVIEALRARAAAACVLITTASARDATRLADRLAILTSGSLVALPPEPELGRMSLGPQGSTSMRVVVSAAQGKENAAALAGILGADEAVTRIETSTYATCSPRDANSPAAVAVSVFGRDPGRLSKAVTRAIAAARVDVELIESSTLPLDAIRAALAARAVSPPPGSLPPVPAGPASIPPSAMAGPAQPASLPPVSVPPSGLPRSEGAP
jgi:ABC-2 type transport system ATP-binding protein